MVYNGTGIWFVPLKCTFFEIKHYRFFFYFLSGGKNILKKYLQKFADIKYLRIFVE